MILDRWEIISTRPTLPYARRPWQSCTRMDNRHYPGERAGSVSDGKTCNLTLDLHLLAMHMYMSPNTLCPFLCSLKWLCHCNGQFLFPYLRTGPDLHLGNVPSPDLSTGFQVMFPPQHKPQITAALPFLWPHGWFRAVM